MSKQLPSQPNLEQLKKRAKSLLKTYQSADPETLQQIKEHHPRWRDTPDVSFRETRFTLADAQLVLAGEYGFNTWSALKEYVLHHQATTSTEAHIRSLHEAARGGDISRLNSLLDDHPELIDETGGRGVRTALHEAVGNQQELAVKLLLERGADPNIRCEGDNAYPLHFAAEKQHFPIVRLLVEHNADVIGEGDYHELGVIGWATAWEYVQANVELVDYLLMHGARHNIFSAVAMGDADAIRELITQTPTNLERRMDLGNRRRMPLHLAVVKRQTKSLTALLEHGANRESLDESFFTPLDQAALTGASEISQILLDAGAKLRLPAAIGLQRAHDVQELLLKDPDSLKPGGRWGTLIVRASERSSDAVIETLIAGGASVNVHDEPKTAVDLTSGYTPLHAAAFHGNLEAVRVLLKHGADVRARETKYHGTPAGWADYAGHIEARDLILREPVDMMEAVERSLIGRIRTILADEPNALNRRFDSYSLYPLYAEGWHTPLAFAVIQGKTEVVQLLSDYGADRSQRSPAGKTLLELARERGHTKIAEILSVSIAS